MIQYESLKSITFGSYLIDYDFFLRNEKLGLLMIINKYLINLLILKLLVLDDTLLNYVLIDKHSFY